jgi:CRISPR-associated protein Csd1
MMLRALHDLAEREGLLDDPDFERHRVDLRIRVARDGALLAVEQVSDGKDVLVSAVPRLPKRSGLAVRPGLLFDLAAYVLGAGKDADRRAAVFRELTQRVAEVTGDPGARAVALFVESQDAVRRALSRRPDWTGGEWVAFTVEGDGAGFVHERPAVRAYWNAQRRQAAGGAAPLRCLVTGELAEPVRLHGSVRMPGTKGAVLVSFNEDSSRLPGVEQGANAPVSRAAAEGYVTALNWLLERVGERRHRQAVPLGDGTLLVYWTREAHPILEAMAGLLDEVAELVTAPWRAGTPRRDIDGTAFYAAVLATNRTRVIVRDWIDTTVTALCTGLEAYAADLRLDAEAADVPTIGALLRAAGDPPPGTGARILRAALRGGVFPRDLLAGALRALYVSRDRVALRTRCALIKAILVRLPRHGGAMEVTVSLDENKVDIPYLLGRLFAVLEQLQWAAHGTTVSATLRDRYFRGAACTPAMVLPRLLELSVHHAAKVARRGRGTFLEMVKIGILNALPAERFPRTMSLEDQGLFAIGYYHQRQRLFQRVDAAPPEARAAVSDPAGAKVKPRVNGASEPAGRMSAPARSSRKTLPERAPEKSASTKTRPRRVKEQQPRAPKRRSAPREK